MKNNIFMEIFLIFFLSTNSMAEECNTTIIHENIEDTISMTKEEWLYDLNSAGGPSQEEIDDECVYYERFILNGEDEE